MIENGGILVLRKKERENNNNNKKKGRQLGDISAFRLFYQCPWPYLALSVVTGATNHPSPFVWCK